MTRKGFFGFRESGADGEERPKVAPITRRNFLVGAGVSTVALAGSGALLEGHRREEEKINGEIKIVHTEIQRGLESDVTRERLRQEYNTHVRKIQTFDSNSPDYENGLRELVRIAKELNSYTMGKGLLSYLPIPEATPYAHSFSEDTKALRNLAVVRITYREHIQNEEHAEAAFQYWHNCAGAYKDLGLKSEGEIKKRLEELFEYTRANNIKVSSISQEQILYSLLDDKFDFSLKYDSVENFLSLHFPDWQKHPETHMNKDTYISYNTPSVIDIFALNRLQRVAEQLIKPAFVKSVFQSRDADVLHQNGESGGTIPLPEKGTSLQVIPATKFEGDASYVVPNQSAVEEFRSVATFHFHATKDVMSPEVQGPSGVDMAFFAPGVVFSSIDKDTILAHFYVSTPSDIAELLLNNVVCLGEIKRNDATVN